MPRPSLGALRGKRVLVTGASGAFGSAGMRVLRHLGADAVGLDRKPDDAGQVLACDVTDEDAVRRAVGAAAERLGGIDRLIHFAGVGPAVDVGAMPDQCVREALEVNLLGTWRTTAAALPSLVREKGRVVVTASLLAGLPLPFASAYVVSKRAVTAYADSLRAEYGTHVGVTTVHPGYVDTPIHDDSRAAGVSLDGLVPAERLRDTVLAVLRAAAAPRPPRDVASTALGTAALRLTRHAPGLVDRVTATEIADLVREGRLSGGEIARGLHERHGAPMPPG
ncbi:SDR family NAD(P)-dependent oxidoreductase [Nocardiopsis chromatogenes]|uniref:SDR family NAD(P)-dependent oxidoreductase n=1 Tax=Nocardiopsis chromatogenes TaxID=280239 RepID=UPI000344DA4E|nr:SDR family NAD(P)-dependent oxidoreductase [Nocardiopsis chromatogenes]